MRFFRAFLATVLVLQPIVASAVSIFPDVPDGDPYQVHIEALVRAGVIHGNPDGTFAPERTVNRAEMLKMLYLATGKTPSSSAKNCFPDVQAGSWYETYVCDATVRKFVQGYPDGTFRPGAPVARVEALKMVFEVFDLPAPIVSDVTTELTDVSSTAWYARYLFAAYDLGVLPVPGMDPTRFSPDKAVLRKEAAAYISGAMQLDPSSSSSSSSSSSMSSVSGRSSSSSSSTRQPTVKNVTFPFSDSGQFEEKDSVSYLFSLSNAKTTMRIEAKITGAITSDITCRLYLLNEEGFSDEYYLGVQQGSSCVLNVSLRQGEYQLQVQPTGDDAYFEVTTTTSSSDGNDGFMEAETLPYNIPRTSLLNINDTHDWYVFTVDAKSQGYLEVSPTTGLGCIIYTPPEVDQFGFEGPKCNQYYEYQPGTYIVGVSHDSSLLQKLTYTVKFR